MAPITPTVPQAGVMATRPATAPEAPPSIEAFLRSTASIADHDSTAAAVAIKVLMKASAAPEVASRLEPALKPNQPTHSNDAPVMLVGTNDRAAATEFAFLVGIPTMFAASGYELLKTLHGGAGLNESGSALALAFVISTVTAFVVVKWLLGYIRSHHFTPFAVYRIVLGAALLLFMSPRFCSA